ncbi:MAG: addiction module protein [Blastopirellula sp.]|nr:MAG: addiction module protein [Blastopirellula sp.]
MSLLESTKSVINSALELPKEQRIAVLNAIHISLSDTTMDHGPIEPATEVQDAWQVEIKERIEEIQSGKVVTVPAAEAERMIRNDVRPSV